MAIRNVFSTPGLTEPDAGARLAPVIRSNPDTGHEADRTGAAATGLPADDTRLALSGDPETTPGAAPPSAPNAPRPVVAGNDTATALEDGPAVLVPVLNNDVGVAGVARINGVAVAPGGSVILQSGARVTVNADGTLSYEAGTAFQGLGDGETGEDVFTYTGADGGGSPVAPEGVFNAAAINGTNGFVIHGAAAGDRSGYAVAGIGDINGDGHDDLLIGALSGDPAGREDAGVSYVVYGRQGGFGPSLDLAGLTAATGFAITGVNAFDFSGAAVSAAGDVNGDGLDDFLIGAPLAEAGQGGSAGESYLVFGRAGGFGSGLDLSTLDGVTGVTFRGVAGGDGLGFSVSAAGDINGDGVDDLILGARNADSGGVDTGASYVVFGRAGGFTAGIDVGGLTGADGFAIVGAGASDQSGYSVAAAGDVNGDGIDDLIIGAPRGDPGGRPDAGEAWVVFGRAGGFGASLDLGALTGANGFSISGVDAGDHAGWSVASAGDLNGDGLADLVVGALYADPGGRENAGETYVVFGRQGGFGANLDLSSLTAATGFTITGTAALNLTGHAVASAGDINGDGMDDLLIGALYADGTGGTDTGETYVVFGRQGGFGSVLDLASLNGQTGFAIGGVAAGDFSGHAVAAAGDVNGDGFDDLLIGAPMASPSGRTHAGTSYVLFGAANVTRFSNDATVTVTITGANDAPVITSNGGGEVGFFTVTENTPGSSTVTAVDPDAGARLVYSILGGADAALFAIDPATGLLRFITPPDFEVPGDQDVDGVYEVIVQVSDGIATDVQTLNVTVTDGNEAPVITTGGDFTTPENLQQPLVLLGFDPEPGTSLTWSIIGGADAALFAIDSQGIITPLIAPDFENPADENGDNVYEIVVQLSDGFLTDTRTVNLTVDDANEAPVITSGGGGTSATASITEGSRTVTTVAAADPDAGSSLTWSIVGGADAALFTINAAGVVRLVNAPDFENPGDADGDNIYEVVVQSSDGSLTDTQTLNVVVTDRNEAPAITSNGGGNKALVLVAEGTTTVTTSLAADPDVGDSVTWSIIGGPDAGLFTVDPSTGVVSFIAGPDFESPADSNGDNTYELVVQASDGSLTDTQTLRVRVGNANEAPVITSNGGGAVGGYTISEGTRGPNRVSAQDPDAGASLTWTIVGGADAALFTINAAGVVQLLEGPDFENPADQDGDNVYEVVVQASDGTLTDTQTLNVTVTDANEAPVITSGGGGRKARINVAEGSTTVTTATAADPDIGDSLTWSIIGGADAALFTIDPATGVVSFVTGPDFEAPADSNGDNAYGLVIQASDGTLTDTQTLRVRVTNANDAPVITSNGGGAVGGYTISENTFGPNPVTATDADAGSSLSYSIIGGADAALFTIDAAGVIRLINAPDFENPADQDGNNVYEVIVQASDGTLTDTQTINVTVTNANEAPVITSGGGGPSTVITRVENSTTVTTLAAADPDAGASLSWSIIAGRDGARFAIDPATGVLTFVAAPDFENPTDQNGDNVYEVDVQVSDGLGGTDVQTIFVNIGNVNEAPVITSNGGGAVGGYSIMENTFGPNAIVATDPDAGSSLTYSIIGGADAALFTINGAGVIRLVNAPDFENPADQNGDNIYEVIVQASDGTLTDTQTINVTVTDANEAPVITSGGGGPSTSIPRVENSTTVTTLAAADPDAGASLSWSIIAGRDGARFAIDPATGVLTFVAAPDFENPTDQNGDNVYEVDVQVSDGLGGTDVQTVFVNIGNVNEAPVITSNGGGAVGGYTISENTFGPNAIMAADPDAGASLTYSIIGGADAALFTINGAGVIRLINAPDFENPADQDGDNQYDVVVQVSDGVNTDTQALRVTVTDVLEGLLLTDVVGLITRNEGDPPALIDTDVTFVDNFGGYAGGSLTVAGLNATDVVGVFSNGSGPGQIGFNPDNGQVSFEGVAIGSVITPPTGSFVVAFNAAATRAAIEALVEALSYRSTSDIPVSAHALTIQITDSAGSSTQPVSIAIQFTADVLNGSAGDDVLSGFRGNDVINGFGGDDTLSGGEGNDSILGGEGDDQLDGGDADDRIDGGAGLDFVTGGDGRDVLTGGDDDDSLFGEDGDDQLEGDAGNDILDGGLANDWLTGDLGNDTLRGDQGLDRLSGDAGDDFLFGGTEQDIVSGGLGVDDLRGEDGDDQLIGGADNDSLDGGVGIDTAIFKGLLSEYTVQIITFGVVLVTGPDGDDLVLNCEFLQFDDQTINLNGASNAPPRITSDGGGALTGVGVDEGQTFVTTVTATDVNTSDTITYSIAGGADAALFAIDPATGVLTFITPPDAGLPTDVGQDNLYDVIVAASDGQLRDLQGISVSVLIPLPAPLPGSKEGGPQVLPGVFDAAGPDPATPTGHADDLAGPGDAAGMFAREDLPAALALRLADADPWAPLPFTAWDDGFG